MLSWTINMADQGVHPAESGFVDDVSPGKFSNLPRLSFLLEEASFS